AANLVAIGGAIGLQENPEHPLQFGPLVGRQLGDRNSGHGIRSSKPDRRLLRQSIDEGQGPLPAVEHGIDAIGRDRLGPEDVALVVGPLVEATGVVAVKDRTAEGYVLRRVAVAPER
ncbi:MAG: hypothetical protein ACK55I_50080, partial [bacterium]